MYCLEEGLLQPCLLRSIWEDSNISQAYTKALEAKKQTISNVLKMKTSPSFILSGAQRYVLGAEKPLGIPCK